MKKYALNAYSQCNTFFHTCMRGCVFVGVSVGSCSIVGQPDTDNACCCRFGCFQTRNFLSLVFGRHCELVPVVNSVVFLMSYLCF